MSAGGATYVAIITDGNGRWAEQRDLPVIEGHRAGADVVKERLRDSARLGIEELTVFSFSTENWSRPKAEVDGLMAMFAERIDRETPELDEEGVRMAFIGRREEVSDELREKMGWAEETTRANDRMKLFVAFNYGGRAEIVDAAHSYGGVVFHDVINVKHARKAAENGVDLKSISGSGPQGRIIKRDIEAAIDWAEAERFIMSIAPTTAVGSDIARQTANNGLPHGDTAPI